MEHLDHLSIGGDAVAAVYLLHFAEAYPRGRRPRHYLGSAVDVAERLEQHRRGEGARLLAVIAAAGISFEVARTWPARPGDVRRLERRLKRQRAPGRFCPLCRGTAR